MAPPPTSTHVVESAVIAAPLAKVWHLLKLQDFSKFISTLESSSVDENTSPETQVYNFAYTDGTKQTIKQEEHSSIRHMISYSVIASEPSLTFTSVLSTIRCYAVTSGDNEGSTFVEWSADFSSDADAGVIEDARFKRKEALAGLAQAVKA